MGDPGTGRVTEWLIVACFTLLCLGGVFVVFGDDLALLVGSTPPALQAQSTAAGGIQGPTSGLPATAPAAPALGAVGSPASEGKRN
jgi:hypothetical protein